MSPKTNPAEFAGQEPLFEVPVPEKKAARVYHFPSAIPEEEMAQRAVDSQIIKSSQAELEALGAIAAENRNIGFRYVGNMQNGTVRGSMITRRAIAAQEDVPADELAPPTEEEMTEAEGALDTFLAGSEEEVHYIVSNIKWHFARSIRIDAHPQKDGDSPNARSTKIVAEDPSKQKELDRKFALFFTKYAGTENRDVRDDRRKSLKRTLKSHGIEV